jgi:hypothetical protein
MTVITDALDLATVQILASPDVHNWPVTAAITRLEFLPADVRVSFTKQDGPDRWPDAVTPGWDGPLQYTLWVVLQAGGQLRTCGCIQFWHGREGVGGPFSNGAKDWWFRVPEMKDVQPKAGDQVGFFVTAGDARLRTAPTSVHERSNIVTVRIPANDTGVFTFPVSAPPVPVPDPTPVAVPTPVDSHQPGVDLTAVLARIDKLETDLRAAAVLLDARLKAIEQRPFPSYRAADGSTLVPE